jgi:hypothetical protein
MMGSSAGEQALVSIPVDADGTLASAPAWPPQPRQLALAVAYYCHGPDGLMPFLQRDLMFQQRSPRLRVERA